MKHVLRKNFPNIVNLNERKNDLDNSLELKKKSKAKDIRGRVDKFIHSTLQSIKSSQHIY